MEIIKFLLIVLVVYIVTSLLFCAYYAVKLAIYNVSSKKHCDKKPVLYKDDLISKIRMFGSLLFGPLIIWQGLSFIDKWMIKK